MSGGGGAAPAIILQRKIRTNMDGFFLTTKTAFKNLKLFLRLVCVQNEATVIQMSLLGVKFGLPGNFTHRFYMNFTFVLNKAFELIQRL